MMAAPRSSNAPLDMPSCSVLAVYELQADGCRPRRVRLPLPTLASPSDTIIRNGAVWRRVAGDDCRTVAP